MEKINAQYKKQVKKIFSIKCLACHGNDESYLPWYYALPVAKQLIDHDREEAKVHMDMSNDFPFGGHGIPQEDLAAIEQTIKKGDMPPLRYKLLHWNSGLTPEEIKIIRSWLDESLNHLKKEE